MFISDEYMLRLNSASDDITELLAAFDPDKINEELAAFQVNAEAQAVKGNKAAGARARKAALELMKDLKEFRKASVEASK